MAGPPEARGWCWRLASCLPPHGRGGRCSSCSLTLLPAPHPSSADGGRAPRGRVHRAVKAAFQLPGWGILCSGPPPPPQPTRRAPSQSTRPPRDPCTRQTGKPFLEKPPEHCLLSLQGPTRWCGRHWCARSLQAEGHELCSLCSTLQETEWMRRECGGTKKVHNNNRNTERVCTT